MARTLGDMDRNIIKKLVPEIVEMQRHGIDLDYLNILPPVANHHSKDESDFALRLSRLSADDMKYLSDRILDGSESLGCLDPEFAEVFFNVLDKKLSSEAADQLREAYESGESSCG